MPTPPTLDPALMQQIAAQWDAAKVQLKQLRDQVEHNSELAQVKLQSSFLSREREVALRDFGAAVWKQVTNGRLDLPLQLYGAIEAMLEMEKRLAKQASEISDILKEGDEAAERQRQKKAAKPAPTLASKGKKR